MLFPGYKQMNKKIFLFFIFLFSINSFSQSAPERDAQIWHDTTIQFSPCKTKNCDIKFLEGFSGFIAGTLRFGDNVSRPVDERIGGGIEMKFNKYFTFAPWYLCRAAQPVGGRKEYEHRIRFDATVENDGKKTWFSLKNRNRFEYRIRHSRADSVRYRNKTTFKVPIKDSEGKEIISPFVADEPYYDFHEKAWTRNEFSVGISKEFKGKFFGASKEKKITTEFFYLLQNNRGNSLKYINVFGAYLKIDLRK